MWRRVSRRPLAEQRGSAGRGRIETEQDVHQRRLARAVASQQPDDLAGADGQRYPVQRRERAESSGDMVGLHQRAMGRVVVFPPRLDTPHGQLHRSALLVVLLKQQRDARVLQIPRRRLETRRRPACTGRRLPAVHHVTATPRMWRGELDACGRIVYGRLPYGTRRLRHHLVRSPRGEQTSATKKEQRVGTFGFVKVGRGEDDRRTIRRRPGYQIP